MAILSVLAWNIFLWKTGVVVVQHRFICKKIEKYIETQNKIPVSLNDINDLKQVLYKTEVCYNPNAWQQAKMPLLQTPLFFSKIVTFGDLSHARLSRWQNADSNE